MREAVKQEIAKEISRQAELYGSLMMQEMKTNRTIAMFYHDCIDNFYKMAKRKVKDGGFGLKVKHFTADSSSPSKR